MRDRLRRGWMSEKLDKRLLESWGSLQPTLANTEVARAFLNERVLIMSVSHVDL